MAFTRATSGSGSDSWGPLMAPSGEGPWGSGAACGKAVCRGCGSCREPRGMKRRQPSRSPTGRAAHHAGHPRPSLAVPAARLGRAALQRRPPWSPRQALRVARPTLRCAFHPAALAGAVMPHAGRGQSLSPIPHHTRCRGPGQWDAVRLCGACCAQMQTNGPGEAHAPKSGRC